MVAHRKFGGNVKHAHTVGTDRFLIEQTKVQAAHAVQETKFTQMEEIQ